MLRSAQETSTLNITVPIQISDQLQQLAQATGRSQISITTQALVDYVERETSQISAIKQGIQAADRGEFASDAEVQARFARWGVKVED